MIKHNYIPLDLHSRLTANIALVIADRLNLGNYEKSLTWWLGLLHDAGWILVRPRKRGEGYKFEHDIEVEIGREVIEKFLDEVLKTPSYEQLSDFLELIDLDINSIVRLINATIKKRINEFKTELSRVGLRGDEIYYAIINADAIATTFEEREVSGELRGRFSIIYFELVKYFTTPLINPARPYEITYYRILLHSQILSEFIKGLINLSKAEYEILEKYGVRFNPIIECTLDGVCYILPEKLNSKLRNSIENKIRTMLRGLKQAPQCPSFNINYSDNDYIQAILGSWAPSKQAEIGCLFCKGVSAVMPKYNIIQLFPSLAYRGRPAFKSTYVSSDRGRRSEVHVTPCPLCVISAANWITGLGRRNVRTGDTLILTYIPKYYEVKLRQDRVEQLLSTWQHVIDHFSKEPSARDILKMLEEDSAIKRLRPRRELPSQSVLLVADIATKNTSYTLLRDIYNTTRRIISNIAGMQSIIDTPVTYLSTCSWNEVQELCDRLENSKYFTPIVINSWKYIHALNAVSIAGEVFTEIDDDIHAALRLLKFIATTMKYMRRREIKYQILSSGDVSDIMRTFCTAKVRTFDLKIMSELTTCDYVHERFDSILRVLSVLST